MKRPLWRVDVKAGCCRRVFGWFDTRKKAQWFIDNRAALPCEIVRDPNPEKHRDWPKAAGRRSRKARAKS